MAIFSQYCRSSFGRLDTFLLCHCCQKRMDCPDASQHPWFHCWRALLCVPGVFKMNSRLILGVLADFVFLSSPCICTVDSYIRIFNGLLIRDCSSNSDILFSVCNCKSMGSILIRLTYSEACIFVFTSSSCF